ncbi:MAG: vWA domain-containing protein [Bacillota bacterium]|nr:vWA domain-containing protein [Bacillota bacterium]
MTDGWDYFGLSDDKGEIIRYVYESRGGAPATHHKEVLVPKKKGITYGLEFYRPDAASGFAAGATAAPEGYVGYKIKAFKDGAVLGDVNVDTALEAKNALQVVFRGTASTPSVALAYRSEQRPNYDTYGVISFVLDNSGSMSYDLKGGSGGESRISKLKKAMKTMLERLMSQEKLVLKLIPFSTTANYPHLLRNTSTEHPEFRSYVPGETLTDTNGDGKPDVGRYLTELKQAEQIVKNMTASGATNIGDGLRRAYYGSIKMVNDLKREGKPNSQQYVIVLVDGVSTTLSGRLANPDLYKGGTEYPYPRNYDNLMVNVGGEKTYVYEYFEGPGEYPFMYWSNQKDLTEFNTWKRSWIQPATPWKPGSQFVGWRSTSNLIPYQAPNDIRIRPKEYANLMAQRVRADGTGNQIRAYLIGFSEKSRDLNDLAELAQNLGIDPVKDLGKRYFRFENKGGTETLDLEAVFRAIETDIMTDLWHIRGPNL